MGVQEKWTFLRASEGASRRLLGFRCHISGLSCVRQSLPPTGHGLHSFGTRTPTKRAPRVKATFQVIIPRTEEPSPPERPSQPEVTMAAALSASMLIGLKTPTETSPKRVGGETEGISPSNPHSSRLLSPTFGLLGLPHGQSRGVGEETLVPGVFTEGNPSAQPVFQQGREGGGSAQPLIPGISCPQSEANISRDAAQASLSLRHLRQRPRVPPHLSTGDFHSLFQVKGLSSWNGVRQTQGLQVCKTDR